MGSFVPTATTFACFAAICLLAAAGLATSCSTDASGRGTFGNQGGSQGTGGDGTLGLGGEFGSTAGSNANLMVDGSSGTGNGQCKNLQCQQFECPAGLKTSVSGTVFDPAGTNPLYNVVVYVPNEAVMPFEDNGVKCSTCGDLYTGHPIASTLTGPDGKFVLDNVPVGNDIPLVIQVGKWRRQIKLSHVDQCKDTAVTADQTRLPRNAMEGDLPKIALATGGADSLECLLLKIGVDIGEFSAQDNAKRVHIYHGKTGGGHPVASTLVGSPEADVALWDKLDDLKKYDVVVMSCEGQEYAKTPAAYKAMYDYAGAGGRIFASHFHYVWFADGPPLFQQAADWSPQRATGVNPYPACGVIDQSFAKGQAFAKWLDNFRTTVNFTCNTGGPGDLPLEAVIHNADVVPAVHKGSQPWITDTQPTVPPNKSMPSKATEYLTFNTPADAPVEQQCGRVVFTDLHVSAASGDQQGGTIPANCTSMKWSPQELALEFMFFDLSSCVQPDTVPPSPPPTEIH
jgi:hypothetical protein